MLIYKIKDEIRQKRQTAIEKQRDDSCRLQANFTSDLTHALCPPSQSQKRKPEVIPGPHKTSTNRKSYNDDLGASVCVYVSAHEVRVQFINGG